MTKEKTVQSEISGYISMLLRKHFGKGPTSVYVTINRPFITIHLHGFLAPMERILVKRGEVKRVLETRDLMMLDLKTGIIQGLKEVADLELNELYADWNLEKETGLIIGIMDEETEEDGKWTDDASEEAFRKRIEEASWKTEKVPGYTEAYWLSDRTVLVRRSGVLVEIEKELIKNGYVEELKLTKRPLEHKMLVEAGLEAVLKRTITETFLDWNFEEDKSYTVFLLEQKEKDAQDGLT